ncbi:hypothetical protein CVU75_03100 [Candidatus Dependentiae bacterium HGW-Dependentiae-1]|nr:MAG: hypothetical protein CVU75_03100 [Candidatus Dependentiae bacterium HGW-Dependentiae-1]
MKKLIIPALFVTLAFTGLELQAKRCRSCASCSSCSSCRSGNCSTGNCSSGNCALPVLSKTVVLDTFVTTFKPAITTQDQDNTIICDVKVPLNPYYLIPFNTAAQELKNLAYITNVAVDIIHDANKQVIGKPKKQLIGGPVHYRVTIQLTPEMYAEFKKTHTL